MIAEAGSFKIMSFLWIAALLQLASRLRSQQTCLLEGLGSDKGKWGLRHNPMLFSTKQTQKKRQTASQGKQSMMAPDIDQ